MVRRAAIVLGVVLTVVLGALSIVVIGVRSKYPAVLNRIRRARLRAASRRPNVGSCA